LKAARKWGYKVKGIPENQGEIITCDGNFHGRTITVVSFSTHEPYREGFGPFTECFVTVPYGDINALERAINKNTIGFLFEPIQGEGGVIIPPHGYLKQVREICTRNNVLMIADEIQTGLGRTGQWFACDWEEVRPDVMIIGKALSGGFYPVSSVLSSAAVLNVFQPGEHGSTFGGNPLACAVAREALSVLKEEKLIENAREQGEYFLGKLARIESEHIAEVRGKGLLIGVELKPSAGGARRFAEALMKEGMLCKETHENVIRFAPPLVINRQDLDWALQRIEKVLMMP
jgi:ornithine--oxo-acid transaminase